MSSTSKGHRTTPILTFCQGPLPHLHEQVHHQHLDLLPTPQIEGYRWRSILATNCHQDCQSTDYLGCGRCESQLCSVSRGYCLSREDVVYDLKEELEIIQGKKKGHQVGLVADGYCVTWDHRVKWGIQLECIRNLWFFDGVKCKDRKATLQNCHRFCSL